MPEQQTLDSLADEILALVRERKVLRGNSILYTLSLTKNDSSPSFTDHVTQRLQLLVQQGKLLDLYPRGVDPSIAFLSQIYYALQ